MDFPDYVPLGQASQALQNLSQTGGFQFSAAFAEHGSSDENTDPNAGTNTNAATKKKRVLLPWVPVASFSCAEAEVGVRDALAELFPGGRSIPGQTYGKGCMRTTEYKCCEFNRSLCDFKVRTRTDVQTGNVAIQKVGSHSHDEDLSLRGIKRSVKEFIWPYMGTRSMKPKHIYGLVVGNDDIPANDKPTLEVRFLVTLFFAFHVQFTVYI